MPGGFWNAAYWQLPALEQHWESCSLLRVDRKTAEKAAQRDHFSFALSVPTTVITHLPSDVSEPVQDNGCSDQRSKFVLKLFLFQLLLIKSFPKYLSLVSLIKYNIN